ncbi:RNA polymerase II elongation factor ELL2-like [Trichomycterus rosablanca]|uniref:RNA polymerase II elongation factor ELL2-like n=1 Tax=Trichomycterus rosablanca TaxID=2290929 RepID=UPI002F351530
MDESLKEYAFFKVLGQWPRYFEMAQVEEKVAREVKKLGRLLSLDTSEQTSLLSSSADHDTAATLPCSSEGSSSHALPPSTESYSVTPVDASPAGGDGKRNKKRKISELDVSRPIKQEQDLFELDVSRPIKQEQDLSELDIEPKSRKARGQGRKRKAEGEKRARKRRRPAPERSHYPAADTTSRVNPVPLPRPVIPKYRLRYTPVLSLEQRDQYVADFMAAKDEYNFLYARIGRTLQHFNYREEQRRSMVPGSEQFQEASALMWCEYQDVLQRHPEYTSDCTRYFYLQYKLAHIRRLVDEYDRSCGPFSY